MSIVYNLIVQKLNKRVGQIKIDGLSLPIINPCMYLFLEYSTNQFLQQKPLNPTMTIV